MEEEMIINDPCEKCDGWKTSDCCGAPCDPDTLICRECHEHCGTWCDDCEAKKEYDDRNLEKD